MQYLSLKSATIEKISPRSIGKIHYRILTDESHKKLYITFTGNDDGGHFSNEIVPFCNIEKCKQGTAVGAYVASKMFFSAFVSRSSNNCGFLAAILRAEELLAPVVDGVRKHVLQSGWDVWQEQMLEEAGEPWKPPLPKGFVVPVIVAKPKASKKAVSEPTDVEVLDAESE